MPTWATRKSKKEEEDEDNDDEEDTEEEIVLWILNFEHLRNGNFMEIVESGSK